MKEFKKRRLGRTELMVTEFALGTYQFTAEFNIPRSDAYAVLRYAFSHGVNFVDTAQMYGYGESEEMVGRIVSEFPDKEIHIATKVGHLYRGILQNKGDEAYKNEDLLMRTVEHSLNSLHKDHIDLFMIHEPDWPHWGFDLKTGDAPVVRLLEKLKREGVIKGIGLGGTNASNVADLVETGRFDAFLIAANYDLVVQEARKRLIPSAKKQDTGIIVGTPFRQGMMVQKFDLEALKARNLDEDTIRRILAIYAISDETGIDLIELSLRYLISDPDISCVATGAQNVQQVEQNMEAVLKGPLPAELVKRLDEAGR